MVFSRVLVPAVVGAMFIAGIPAGLLGMLWAPLAYSFWIMFPVVSLGLAAMLLQQGVTPMKCEQCLRRLRPDQQVCHKCLTPVQVVAVGS